MEGRTHGRRGHVRGPTSAGLSRRISHHLLLILIAALATLGCNRIPQMPPESPDKQAIKDERIEVEDDLDPERRHLAPPPAYGNKVVVATNQEVDSESF